MQIQGSNAIMVGGASGMCLATAERFVERGGRVAILDLERSDGASVAKRLGGTFHPCNVMDFAGIESVIAEAVAALGSVHFMVNTAGGGVAKRTLSKEGEMHPLDDFRRIIDLNLIASFNINRIVASHMNRNEPNADGERGVMISTASVAAYDGQIGQAAYSASKGGVVGMTLPIARDLARNGIRNMTIAPGIFGTPMVFGMPQEVQDALAAAVPFPSRLGTPNDYAKLVKHILENDMLNGEVIRLDGAIRLAPK